MSLGHTKYDRSVVSKLKTMRILCCRLRRRAFDTTWINGRMAVDLNSAMGFLVGAVLVFVIFCTKEEEYPLEINTDNRWFFCLEVIDGLVTKFFAWSRLTD